MQGYIIHFNEEKGYGFIRSEESEENIFVHISEVTNADNLEQGQEVEFQLKKTAKGLSAVSVKAGAKQRSPYLIFGVVSSLITLAIFAYATQQLQPLLAYLVAINISTFLLYGYDKFISRTEMLRVPELNLQVLALIGGSPAALLAQRFFRHKTIKESFQIIYWIIVAIQFGLLIFMMKD